MNKPTTEKGGDGRVTVASGGKGERALEGHDYEAPR